VASLDATPTITPYLTYQRTNDGGDFIGAGLTFPLPLWNRNEGEKTRAVAERRITEARSNYLQQGGLRTQIASLRSVTLAEEAQATLYRSRVVPAFAEALKAQQKLYTEGRGGVLEVWQMLRTFHEVQLRSLELELRAVAKKASLSLLIGEELPR
jgi:outer membrane protein TolC